MTSPFIAFDTQYSAHTDLAIHPVTGVVYITVAFHPNNQGGYNCRVWSLPPPYTGKPTLIRDWVQGQYSIGPFGHGASIPLPTGALLTCVPVASDTSDVKPSLLVDVGASPPYVLGGVGPKGDKGDPGPQGEPGAGGGTLAPEDVEALRRLKVWLGIA